MKKSILAIFLAVIAMAQVHAQDSDLRSAPDLPTFKVTLNYSSANTDQGTITSTVATGSKVAYNSKPVFTITAKPGSVSYTHLTLLARCRAVLFKMIIRPPIPILPPL